MTSATVRLAALATGAKALFADNVEAVVANQVASSRIETSLAGQTVKGFQYRVVSQGERFCFLSSLDQQPEYRDNGFNADEGDGLDLQVKAVFADQVLYLTL